MKKALVSVVLALVLVASSAVSAQVLYGTIVGNVKDPSGGVIPGASVTVTNQQTNQSQELVTNDTGIYTARNLQAGTYTVKISLAGFKEFIQTGISVTPNNVTRLDAELVVGEVNQSITVSGSSAGQLQTDTTDVRQELLSKEITELPSNLYRNYQSLMDLVPGATPSAFQNASMDLPQRSLTTNVNGAARNSNNTRLDGVNNMMAYYPHQTLYIPPQESVNTVNVATNSFDAEQGMAGGAAITVQTKSGNNDFHGVAFEYLNNSALSARNFFTPQGSGVPKKIVNMYGGTFGGPIKKDKLFFFFSYEAMRDRSSYSSLTTIPTAELRNGDFSATGVKLYDPNTGNVDGSGRTQFANAIIPADRISSVAQKMLALVPQPNLPGFVDNYYISAPMVFDRNNYDTRLDWMVNPQTTIWGKYSIMQATVDAQYSLGDAGGPGLSDGGAGKGSTRIQLASIGLSKMFSSTFLVDGTMGWSRYGFSSIGPDYGTNYALDVFGIPGTNGPDPRQSGLPNFAITGYTSLGATDSWIPTDRRDNTYTSSWNASWLKGSHDIRFGSDIDRRHINHWQAGTEAMGPRGGFRFTGGISALKGGSSPSRFNSMADFLLGMPFSTTKTELIQATIREWTFGLYFRDRWQVTQNLTLTLGLRWENYPMPTRDHRGIERYDPETNLVTIGGIAGNPDAAGAEAGKKDFAPRLGFAYRMGSKSVLRAGYGITIDPFSIGRAMRSNYPIVNTLTVEGSNSFQPYAPISQGIPPITFPDISSGSLPLPTNIETAFLPAGTFRRGYIQSWNLTYERHLPFGMVGSVGYVATRSIRQRTSLEVNAAPPGGGSKGRALFQKFGRTAGTEMHTAWQNALYDSLQTSLNRKFAGGLYMKTSYTWSKGIGYNDDSNGRPMFLYPEVWAKNRAVQSYDRTHVFRQAFIYELPFGASRKWAQSGFVSRVIGGWQVNGIFSSYTGLPFTVTANGASLNAPGNTQVADQVLQEVEKLGGIGKGSPWLDPLAFRPVTEVRFGNVGRNSLRGPGLVGLDMCLFRSMRLSEKVEMQVRAEGFNITNTPHFLNPTANASELTFNTDGTLKSAGSFMSITRAAGDQRNFRFGVRLSF